MRILVISNLYPPHYVGGYELGCQDVVDGLKNRGHQVRVLTSSHGLPRPGADGEVHRRLDTDEGRPPRSRPGRLRELLRQQLVNRRALTRLAAEFRPEVVYVWNLKNVTVNLAFAAQLLGAPVCYYVFDHWLASWKEDPWHKFWTKPPESLAERIAQLALTPVWKATGLIHDLELDLSGAQFASAYLKDLAVAAGVPAAAGEVIPFGLERARFPRKESVNDPKRILYVGQLVPHKGVHTLVEAIKLIARERGSDTIKLTIAGGTTMPEYAEELKRSVASSGLEDSVGFIDFVSRDELPSTYRAHDVFVFPSTWDEPFGITLLEAMASGLAVVASGTGGSAEIVVDNENALLFPPGDAEALADRLIRLLDAAALFERIRAAGLRAVEDRFQLESVIDRIEASLAKALERA